MTAAPVDTITGEVLDRDGARRRANRIRGSLEATWQLVVEAYQARDWLALGYPSWDEYCRMEFGSTRIAIPREERSETIGSLRDAGLSLRAIAAATGLGRGTVERAVTPPVPNGTPDLGPALDEETDTSEQWFASATAALNAQQAPEPEPTPEPEPVATVIGIDGKRYTRTSPAPAPPKPTEQAPASDNWVVKNAEQRAEKFAEALAVLELTQHQEARSYTREAFATHSDAVRPAARALHTPQHIRATAQWLTLYADELEGPRRDQHRMG